MLRFRTRRIAGALLLGSALAPAAPSAETFRTAPGDDWCGAVNRAGPGDTVLLGPGTYTRPCTIRVSGAPGRDVVIRSADRTPGRRAVLSYRGTTSNVLDLQNVAHLVLEGLDFHRTERHVDAIKIHRSSDVVIRDCSFTDIGGISVSAVSGSSRRITVRGNVLRDLRATGMYFGCHDGEQCQASGIVVEENLIDGVESGAVGYGIQIKLNSSGRIRGNTVYDTKGPGIMVYGSNRGGPPSFVERNYVEGSRTDAPIVLGGGPAVVRNNVVLGGAAGGIVAQDYAGRGLQRGVHIVHNTVLHACGSGIRVESWAAGGGNVLANNAVAPRPDATATIPDRPEGTVSGNVACPDPAVCFADPARPPYDLGPRAGGPLVDAGGRGLEPWRPVDDFAGTPRPGAADVGAFEGASGTRVGGGRVRSGLHAAPPAPAVCPEPD